MVNHNHDSYEPIEKNADVVLEISWEVVNKVGGIYTVIMSKAEQATANFKNYYCIGPYFHNQALGEFEEFPAPDEMKAAFAELQAQGIRCHYGKWLIKGEPQAILIDFQNFYAKTNEIKGNLWNWYKIDSLNAPLDFNEPITWAYAVGMVVEKLVDIFRGQKIVAQFHEWLAGAGLLYLQKREIKVGTVFTTHATILGRSIASSKDLYSIIDTVDADKEAYNYGIPAKYQLEKQSALNADVFTTVSEITGFEAEKLLKRKPDVLLPNGLDMGKFPSFEEISIKHQEMKFRIKEFMLYFFFPHYAFDIDNTLIYFIFARYEYQNKGIDVFIQALTKLNETMKNEKSEKTIVAFFFIPAGVKSIKTELVENRQLYEDVKETVDMNAQRIRNSVLLSLVSRKQLVKENIFSQEFMSDSKKKVMRFLRGGKPIISTHDLFNEQNDSIFQGLMTNGLDNLEDDRVKVVFYPAYLSGADGLLDLNYYETISGCHLGVFPSAYEPWGYTPLEAGALGVASITTDLAGFGQYINKQRPKEICQADHCDVLKESGIYVIRRNKKSTQEIVDELYNVLYHYQTLEKPERIENKIEARRLAMLADWKLLFNNYIRAYNEAVKKVYK